MEYFKQLLINSLNFQENHADDLLSVGSVRTYEAKSYFIEAGEIPRKFGFIRSGLFRYVYINDEGTEYTKGIIREHRFVSSYSAMIAGTPSHFYVEALEPSTVLEIPYQKWLHLRPADPFWDRLLVTLLEKAFTIKEKRERELLLLDAETRYKIFLEEFPGLDRRVKQHIIASYLGIQPESLSRIRKKIAS
jgi:CRP-like cAMP-binding protein